jgi:hypothetical protein
MGDAISPSSGTTTRGDLAGITPAPAIFPWGGQDLNLRPEDHELKGIPGRWHIYRVGVEAGLIARWVGAVSRAWTPSQAARGGGVWAAPERLSPRGRGTPFFPVPP